MGMSRICALVLLICTWAGAQERTGYRIWRDQVLVEGLDHWRAWESGDGVRVIEDDGTVRPRFLRRDINAMLDAGEFMNTASGDTTYGGISRVGVLPQGTDTLAVPILDGDIGTYWEPDPEEHPDNLWVEVDLGRTVIARRVVVRFVEEGQGDPFLKFRVLVSDGTNSFGSRHRREFRRVGQVSVPNKDQRVFEFEVEPFRPVPEGIVGEPVQFVRIDLLDTDGLRGEEVSRERHFRLGPEDKGTIDYFRRTVSGREIPVVKETYDQLPAEERGAVRYYRRERPRLAELEVYSLGDNIITLTQRALFAQGDFFEDVAKRFVTDGLLTTAYPIRVYDRLRDEQQVTVDLGGKFWLERLRLLSGQDPFTSYQLRVSDGSLDATGGYLWYAFEERLNREEFLQVEERFDPRPVRLIELRRLDLLQEDRLAGVLNEIQAYGEGYVADLVMTSPLIKLGQRRMFSRVRWGGSAPPGTNLEIRTRSGDQLIQIPHYFNRANREVSAALYERLREEDKGPIRTEEIPGPDWSAWSAPYQQSGEAFKSPTPRLNTMVQVRLRSSEPLRFSSIQSLSMDFEPPLVDKVVAEIWPVRDVAPGVEQEFRLFVRPAFQEEDPGFDRLRLSSSSTVPIELLEVHGGTEQDLRFGQADLLWPGIVRLETLADGGLELIFPATASREVEVMELVFRNRVFLPSTDFRLELRNREREEVVQVVDSGDASSLLNSNSLVVVADLSGVPLVGEFLVQPSVFTPNGDGINDQTLIQFSVFHVEADRRIRFEVCDLTGRRMRDLSLRTAQPSGEHQTFWDGRNDNGELLPPGIYLVRVALPTDADAGGTVKVRTVSLVY